MQILHQFQNKIIYHLNLLINKNDTVLTCEEFRDVFIKSKYFPKEHLETDPKEFHQPENPREQQLLNSGKYVNSYWHLFKVVFARNFTLLLRNKGFMIGRIV